MRIRGSWIVAGVLSLLLVLMLVIAGWAGSEIANDATARDLVADDAVPGSVHGGGPIVDATQDEVVSREVPDHTIALTFDDGPDPRWTPEVLEVLRKHDVPGTFFVVGSMAARHPDLVRQIHESGSELGVHTFTHADLSGVNDWRFDREMGQTQLALVGAADVTTRLFRPPFSSTVGALDNPGYRVVEQAGELGYISVFTTADSEDWQKPGVAAIVRNSTPSAGEGEIVLMHDAGGDRSQTVAALDILIPRLKAQGYRFTTVTGAVGRPPAEQPAQPSDELPGTVLVTMVGVSVAVVAFLKWLLIAVGLLTVARLLLLVTAARRHARRRREPGWRWGPPVTDPVSVIVPAYNEAANIEATVRTAVASTHDVEVIVVDDGSTDGTADLVENLGLPRVRVIRQVNSGKAAALNNGIAAARHELIVMVDGDTVFEPDTVSEMVQPFADPDVGTVAGNVKIANRDSFLSRLQHIEYVVGFNVDRRVHDLTRSMPTVPGAGGAFRRRVLAEVGGLSAQTLAEDTDLTIAIGRAGWRIVYQDSAVTWTEAPTTVRQLWQQRFRWTFGTMQAIWKHRRCVFQRGDAGKMGRYGLLHVVAFQILLPVSAPVIDVFLLYGLLFLNPATTLLLWCSMLVAQSLGALYAFALDREHKGALWLLPAQQLVYRQLMYVVLMQSLTAAVAGIRVRWQHMRRAGVLAGGRQTPVPQPTSRPPRRSRLLERLGNRTAAAAPVRERWLDVLRGAALVRVVLYHTTGWGWLSLVFPSMGVMFALAGSLTARSMANGPVVDVVGRRIRRLLPPLWVLAIIMVPLMLLHGWNTIAIDEHDKYVLNWPDLVFWIFPILDPPSSSWTLGLDASLVLWYLRAYLWFVLLTPLLLRAFRARPVLTVVAPLALVALDGILGSPLSEAGDIGSGVLDFCTFGACWVLGFAHRHGVLGRLHAGVLLLAAVTAVGLGGWWTATHPMDGSYDVNDIPLGNALISTGAVLILLRVSPSLEWLQRTPVLGRLVALLNARALTIYLWHNVAIDLAVPITDWFGYYSVALHFGLACALTGVAVLAFGWVEDLAARRRVRMLPPAAASRAPSRVDGPAVPTG
jgi:cellulose synthase/poly-beta-1,6-N-acetylglucosamine synthase-like glycosyltransferase/peptidoglycan/xylan/chitin deacetylase (PgdA/CDA1 family)/peptidoglycan/LPS O-acetylase OafA/YrhL